MISMLNSWKYSRTFANGHLALYNGHFFFLSRRTKNPYIDSFLKPLNNGHLFTSQLYSIIHSSLYENKPL